MRIVVPAVRSRRNTSREEWVSAGTRLVADESNAMTRPSALIDGRVLSLSPCIPLVVTLTRSVVLVFPSCTKTSTAPLVSFATRLFAAESKAVHLPLIDGREYRPLMPFPWAPEVLTLTRLVDPEEIEARARDGDATSSEASTV